MRLKWLAFCAAVAAAPASAEPGYYFHKPGVERGTFEADLGGCLSLSGGVSVSRQFVSSANPYAAAVGGFLSGLLAARERRTMVANIMRTCMTDRGYRRIAAPKAVLKQVASGEDAQRIARLYDLATQSQPLGEVLPK